jgi:hypothetical protein
MLQRQLQLPDAPGRCVGVQRGGFSDCSRLLQLHKADNAVADLSCMMEVVWCATTILVTDAKQLRADNVSEGQVTGP